MMISENVRVFLKSFPMLILACLGSQGSLLEMNHYHMAGVMGDSVVLPNSLFLHKRELVVIQRDTERRAHTAHIGHSCEVLKHNILINHSVTFAQHIKSFVTTFTL